MVNWNAIILELMQEHGLLLEEADKRLVSREYKLQKIIEEWELPVIEKPFTLPMMCKNFNRLTK
jgi:hypothetical protein